MDSKHQNSKDQQLNLVDLLMPVNSATTIGSAFSSNNSEKYSSNDDLNSLNEFCEEIEDVIKRAEERLVRAYESKAQRKLENRLNIYVKKLRSLHVEMKTITDNISSIKKQCASVKGHLRDIKREVKSCKDKEMNHHHIGRLPIDIEKRKLENTQNRNNTMNPEYNFRQVIPIQQSTTSKRIRSNELSLSRFFDSATGHEPTATRSRVTFNGSTVKKLKKLKKENNNIWPQSTWGPVNNGVTLDLFPVNRDVIAPVPSPPKVETINKIEKIKFPTPTTSTANISWRSTQTDLSNAPEPPPTDTTASSLTSKLNLLIIDSDELDELD